MFKFEEKAKPKQPESIFKVDLTNVKVVFFDADGVLLDSLKPHLDFCNDMAIKYSDQIKELGGTIQVLDVEGTRELAANTKITPMERLLELFGFPDELISEIINKDYIPHFSQNYTIKPFSNIGILLKILELNNKKIVLVTSNYLETVKSQLGSYYDHFSLSFGKDKNSPTFDKTTAMEDALQQLGFNSKEAIFISDTSNDKEASDKIGIRFLGANWGFEQLSYKYIVYCNTVNELIDILKVV